MSRIERLDAPEEAAAEGRPEAVRAAPGPTRPEVSPPVSDRIEKTTCYMCACRYGINVHIRDGKVRYIEGNRDHPVNRGVLCAKGSAGIIPASL
jgi:anaerobic selenocysteine-containing dehydrogenase